MFIKKNHNFILLWAFQILDFHFLYIHKGEPHGTKWQYLTKGTNHCIQCKKLKKLYDVRILILYLKR